MTKLIALGRTASGRLLPIAVDENGRLIIASSVPTIEFVDLTVTNLANIASAYLGGYDAGNYTNVETDGTLQAFGNATCFRDELQSITGAQIDSPAGDFQRINAEGNVLAKISARYPTDYIWGSWQLNHDWVLGTTVEAHLHWEQTTANTPNWLFAYRWQRQGKEKTTAWSLMPWTVNAFAWDVAYTTLDQITSFGEITPPAGYGQVSDIIQIRLYRDYTNVSTLFTGGDPVNAGQAFVNIDGHINVDMLGSHQRYIK